LDTNIIISGLYSKRGASYQLLRAAISGELTFIISPLVAFEYEGKIYQKIEQGFLKVSKEDCGLILDALFAVAEIVWKPVQNKAGFYRIHPTTKSWNAPFPGTVHISSLLIKGIFRTQSHTPMGLKL